MLNEQASRSGDPRILGDQLTSGQKSQLRICLKEKALGHAYEVLSLCSNDPTYPPPAEPLIVQLHDALLPVRSRAELQSAERAYQAYASVESKLKAGARRNWVLLHETAWSYKGPNKYLISSEVPAALSAVTVHSITGKAVVRVAMRVYDIVDFIHTAHISGLL